MPAIMGKNGPAMSEIVWSRGKKSFLFVDVRATLGSHLSSLLKLEKISKFLDASKWVKVVKDASTLMRSTFSVADFSVSRRKYCLAKKGSELVGWKSSFSWKRREKCGFEVGVWAQKTKL
jgi:hypothetical protein